MKFIKKNLISIIICALELIVGILLLVNPHMFTTGIIMGGGIVLCVVGVLFVMKYFRSEAQVAAKEQSLVKGLALIMFGVLLALNAATFIKSFELLTVLYGAVILLVGLTKIQAAADLIRAKHEKWFWNAIGAGVTLVCAAIILTKALTSLKRTGLPSS